MNYGMVSLSLVIDLQTLNMSIDHLKHARLGRVPSPEVAAAAEAGAASAVEVCVSGTSDVMAWRLAAGAPRLKVRAVLWVSSGSVSHWV